MKKVLSLCVFCVFLLSLAGSCGIGADEGTGKTIDVVIREDDTAKTKPMITVSPYSLGANFGDTIVWRSEYPFAIHFGMSSPVEGLVFWGKTDEEVPEIWEQAKNDLRENDWEKIKYIVTAKVVHNPKESGGIKAVYYIAFYNDRWVGIIDPDIVVPPKGGGHGN